MADENERTKEVSFRLGRTIYAGERREGYSPYEAFSVEYGEVWHVMPGEDPNITRAMLMEHVATEHRKMVLTVEHSIKGKL